MPRVVPVSANAIETAAVALRRGELVAFPTETVYGLGADARNESAIAAVYRLKGRPTSHPLIVHLPTAATVWQWADRDAHATTGVAPDSVERLASELWPGPYTLVLHASEAVSRAVTGGQDTVALRVPANEVARTLLAAFGAPVVAPSANRFGRVSPTLAAHVAEEFRETGGVAPLLILDGGPTRWGLESAVIDLTTPVPRLLRPGARPVVALEDIIRTELGVDLERPSSTERSSGVGARETTAVPRAPGTLEHHYAPVTPVRVVTEAELRGRHGGAAVIARTADPGSDGGEANWLTLPDDAEGFGREFYAALRTLDAVGARAILVQALPSGDEWLAVRDRLERAAAAHSSGPPETATEETRW